MVRFEAAGGIGILHLSVLGNSKGVIVLARFEEWEWAHAFALVVTSPNIALWRLRLQGVVIVTEATNTPAPITVT